jgi:L-ascorbate metabolism protein UlaG (beta-lactamase superfamily)
MQPGGTKDFKFAKVTMVHGEQSGVCQRPDGRLVPGGNGVGFIVNIPHHNLTIYHSGITSIFSDMKLINDLYKPDIAIIAIGDDRGMRPATAAYATKNFLNSPKTIIPMYFSSLPCFKDGTVENFTKACKEAGVEGKTILNPKDYNKGKAIIE